MEDYLDRPVFKRLAANDTSSAPGHQGGIVIPLELVPYFPVLESNNESKRPTSEVEITAELLVDGHPSVKLPPDFSTRLGVVPAHPNIV